MTDELDTDQVLELMLNGFDHLWACAAVAESHGQPRDGDYFRQLYAATDGVAP